MENFQVALGGGYHRPGSVTSSEEMSQRLMELQLYHIGVLLSRNFYRAAKSNRLADA
jgi:hypothetical protein